MKVKLEVVGYLKYLFPDRQPIELNVDPDATVRDLMSAAGLGDQLSVVAMIKDRIVSLDDSLAEGDSVTVISTVSGG